MKNLLFLPGNGVALQVRRGSLCVRDPNGTKTLHPARVHGLKTIILAGRGGSITDESIRWTAREGVALYLMCRNGEAFAVIGEAVDGDHRRAALTVRQRQFRAVLDTRLRLEIARKIVAAKLRTLDLHPVDARAFREEIARAIVIPDLLTAEARAGACYFMRWRGTELRMRGEDTPCHWLTFTARAAGFLKGRGGTSKARYAATPIGAALNYSFTVGLGQCMRACVAVGLDPCFGFLHSPKPGRLSLAYDVLELHRADLTCGVFDHVAKTSFARDAFEQSPAGVVSLGPGVARDIAALALRVASLPACGKSVRRVCGWL